MNKLKPSTSELTKKIAVSIGIEFAHQASTTISSVKGQETMKLFNLIVTPLARPFQIAASLSESMSRVTDYLLEPYEGDPSSDEDESFDDAPNARQDSPARLPQVVLETTAEPLTQVQGSPLLVPESCHASERASLPRASLPDLTEKSDAAAAAAAEPPPPPPIPDAGRSTTRPVLVANLASEIASVTLRPRVVESNTDAGNVANVDSELKSVLRAGLANHRNLVHAADEDQEEESCDREFAFDARIADAVPVAILQREARLRAVAACEAPRASADKILTWLNPNHRMVDQAIGKRPAEIDSLNGSGDGWSDSEGE